MLPSEEVIQLPVLEIGSCENAYGISEPTFVREAPNVHNRQIPYCRSFHLSYEELTT